eukprot:GFUD01062837.1.p1 GENE.GFUD01062837.1~~GFUD01062837.1.p1  ORF type:complete len:158 (-),score=47.88 GFUD01062837.1:103-576(-)
MADESQPSSHSKDKENEQPSPITPAVNDVQLSPRQLLTRPEMTRIDHLQRTLQNSPANMYHVPEGLKGMGPSLFGGMPPFHGMSGGPRGPPPLGIPSWGMPGPGSPGVPPLCFATPGPGMPPMDQGKWSEHRATDGGQNQNMAAQDNTGTSTDKKHC